MKKIRFTKDGFEKIKKNNQDLLLLRPAAVLDLKKAREMGDLSENGYYKAARSKLSSIDYNLRKFAYDIKNAVVVENTSKEFAGIGCTVTLQNDDREVTYFIVGDFEANPTERKISLLSPIGRALENRKVGDEIEINTPNGKITYKLIKIF